MNGILKLKIGDVTIEGELVVPAHAHGLVIFSHGSGSSRFSPRNNFVAQYLQRIPVATFLCDLLTKEEDQVYANRFNIELLSHRLVEVTGQLAKLPETRNLSIGYFGASTGAASALVAAATLHEQINAVVSRGGRPDLALNSLHLVKAPTLLIVGELDREVLKLNNEAMAKLTSTRKLEVVKNATHLFEEAGALEQVAFLSGQWFGRYLSDEKFSRPRHDLQIQD
jgi:pimeloyl-ACP methyl ester carboxylesterase